MWQFLYNPKSDTWEFVSNNGFSTKEGAEQWIKNNVNEDGVE